MPYILLGFCVVAAIALFKTVLIVPARHTVIKERLGDYAATLKPGIHFLVPILHKAAYTHEMREQVLDIPPQDCITRDNIQVTVDGVVYLKVIDPRRASYGISNYRAATINLAQTTMRAEMGKLSVDETFSERERVNESIVREIDKASDPWGIKMIRYEISNIEPSPRIVETMEKQMEAEREKRAVITRSDGQKQARIMIANAQRQRAINESEGARQKRVNEAAGRAEEIRLVAEAQAKGMELVAAAIDGPGGRLAVQTQLIEEYLEQFGRIMKDSDITVLPAEVAQLRGALDGVSKVMGQVHGGES